MEYYSVKKRMKFCICSNMDGLRDIMLSRISQRKINTARHCLYVESKNKNTTN